MRKSSVYLPDDLKRAVHDAAARAGTSEADFIRTALETAVHRSVRAASLPPAPPMPRLAGPLLIGVGVGPGAADLLTPRARSAIEQADVVVAAAISPDAIGRAEATVRAALGHMRVTRVHVDVNAPPEGRALAQALLEYLDRGAVVAFLTIGDPSMFSIFAALAAAVRQLRPELPVRVVPGVMAFQELAARAGVAIGTEHHSVRIVAAGGDLSEPTACIADSLERADETLVLYRGGRLVPAIARQLRAAGRANGAVVGELLGLPGERCAPALDYLDQPASYLATLIAPAPGRA